MSAKALVESISTMSPQKKILIIIAVMALVILATLRPNTNSETISTIVLCVLPLICLLGCVCRVRGWSKTYWAVMIVLMIYPALEAGEYFFGFSKMRFFEVVHAIIFGGFLYAFLIFLLSKYLLLLEHSKNLPDRDLVVGKQLPAYLLFSAFSFIAVFFAATFSPLVNYFSYSEVFLFGECQIVLAFGISLVTLGVLQKNLEFFVIGLLISVLCGSPLLWATHDNWVTQILANRGQLFNGEFDKWFPLPQDMSLLVLVAVIYEVIIGVFFWNRLRPAHKFSFKELTSKRIITVLSVAAAVNAIAIYTYRIDSYYSRTASFGADFSEVKVGFHRIKIGEKFEEFFQNAGISMNYGTSVATKYEDIPGGKVVHMGNAHFLVQDGVLKKYVLYVNDWHSIKTPDGLELKGFVKNAEPLLKHLGDPLSDTVGPVIPESTIKDVYRTLIFNPTNPTNVPLVINAYFIIGAAGCPISEDGGLCLWGIGAEAKNASSPAFPSLNVQTPDIAKPQTTSTPPIASVEPTAQPSAITVPPLTSSSKDSTDLIVAMINASRENRLSEIEAMKSELDGLPKGERGNRKLAREKNRIGLDSLKAEDYKTAVVRFSEGLAFDPSDVEIRNNLGYAELKGNDFVGAKSTLIKSLIFDPSRSSSWANLGQVYAKLRDEASATSCFKLTYLFSRAPEKTVEFFKNLSESDSDEKVRNAAATALRDFASIQPLILTPRN